MAIETHWQLSRWGDGAIHLYYEDHLHGEDIDIVLDLDDPCVNGEGIDVVAFLRNLVIVAEKAQGLRR